MKKFAAYFGFIAAIFIVLMFGLDKMYTYGFTHGIPRSKLRHLLQQQNVTFDYLFFGSSRTEFNIDCELVEKLTGKSCVNYGISGTTLMDTYTLLRLMEARNVSFKNAFVQVDYLYNVIDFSPSFKAELLPFQNDPKIWEILESYDNSFSNKYIPFYRYMVNDHVIGFREIFNLLIHKRPKIDFNNGFVPKYGSRDDILRSLPNNIIETNESIEAMIVHFNKLSVPYYLFTAPICKTTVDRNSYMEKLKTKIPDIYNYVPIFDDNDDYFFDCAHLNNTGAQAFTSLIIKNLILKTN
jgi:hypothetical protein